MCVGMTNWIRPPAFSMAPHQHGGIELGGRGTALPKREQQTSELPLKSRCFCSITISVDTVSDTASSITETVAVLRAEYEVLQAEYAYISEPEQANRRVMEQLKPTNRDDPGNAARPDDPQIKTAEYVRKEGQHQ